MIDNEFILQDRIQKIQQIIGKYGEEKEPVSLHSRFLAKTAYGYQL